MSGESKSGSRIEYIDIAKALGIILVIAGHVVSSDTGIKRVIYAFHMPLFFILSGMLLKVKSEYSAGSWRSFIVKKFKALMVPYFIWALIYSAFSFKHVALAAYGTRETLIMAESLTSLWFLPVMFLAFMIVELILWLSTKTGDKRTFTIIGCMVACYLIGFAFPHHKTFGDPWGIDIAFIAAAFMILGMMIQRAVVHLPNMLWKAVAAAIACIVFIITVRFSISSVGYVLMANADYGSPLVFIINAGAGSLFVILISCLIEMVVHKTRALSWIGQRTLGIFVVHKPIVELGRMVATRMGISFDNPLIVASITAGTLVVSSVIVGVIEKVIPGIIGTKNTKKEVHHE